MCCSSRHLLTKLYSRLTENTDEFSEGSKNSIDKKKLSYIFAPAQTGSAFPPQCTVVWVSSTLALVELKPKELCLAVVSSAQQQALAKLAVRTEATERVFRSNVVGRSSGLCGRLWSAEAHYWLHVCSGDSGEREPGRCEIDAVKSPEKITRRRARSSAAPADVAHEAARNFPLLV